MSSQRGKVPIIYSEPTEQLHTASARLLSASLPLSGRLHRRGTAHTHTEIVTLSLLISPFARCRSHYEAHIGESERTQSKLIAQNRSSSAREDEGREVQVNGGHGFRY